MASTGMLLGTTHTGKALIHRILRGRPFRPLHTGSLDVSMQPEVLSSIATRAIGALEKWRALACCSALLIQGRPSYTASYAAAPSPLYIQGLSNEAGLSYAATYTAVLARFTFQAGPTYDRNIHDRPSLQTPYCQGPSYQVAHAVALMRDPPHLRALFIRRSVPYLHMVALPPPPSSSPSPNRGLG